MNALDELDPLDVLETYFAEVVRSMPDDIFDSHAFILKLINYKPAGNTNLRNLQRPYVRALAATVGQDPFRQVHGLIANRLGKYTELVRKLGDVKIKSNNIFGELSDNQQWQRV